MNNMISKWFNDLTANLDKWAEHINAETKHIVETNKNNTVKNVEIKKDLSFKNAQKVMKKNGKEYFFRNVNVTQATQNFKKLLEGNSYISKVMKIAGSKIGKKTLHGVAIVLGAGLLMGALRPKQESAIPKKYQRGYDNISQTLTDFGSAVHLDKASQKVIVPYYSSTRDSVITSTSAITKGNIALASNKNAIRHTRY
jgi:hypothetical protein